MKRKLYWFGLGLTSVLRSKGARWLGCGLTFIGMLLFLIPFLLGVKGLFETKGSWGTDLLAAVLYGMMFAIMIFFSWQLHGSWVPAAEKKEENSFRQTSPTVAAEVVVAE